MLGIKWKVSMKEILVLILVVKRRRAGARNRPVFPRSHSQKLPNPKVAKNYGGHAYGISPLKYTSSPYLLK